MAQLGDEAKESIVGHVAAAAQEFRDRVRTLIDDATDTALLGMACRINAAASPQPQAPEQAGHQPQAPLDSVGDVPHVYGWDDYYKDSEHMWNDPTWTPPGQPQAMSEPPGLPPTITSVPAPPNQKGEVLTTGGELLHWNDAGFLVNSRGERCDCYGRLTKARGAKGNAAKQRRDHAWSEFNDTGRKEGKSWKKWKQERNVGQQEWNKCNEQEHPESWEWAHSSMHNFVSSKAAYVSGSGPWKHIPIPATTADGTIWAAKANEEHGDPRVRAATGAGSQRVRAATAAGSQRVRTPPRNHRR